MIPQILFAAAVVLVLCFGFVLAFGAPYLPTMKPQVVAAFELLDLQPGLTMIELGCGDGKLLIAAAQRGIRSVGYELNPLLFLLCLMRTRRYRKLVTVRFGDFWRADWPKADAVFGFILPRLMHKLDEKIIQEERGPLLVVSFAFKIPGRDIVAEKSGVFLYRYK
jgi:SAM-dependent methyltransferase